MKGMQEKDSRYDHECEELVENPSQGGKAVLTNTHNLCFEQK